jgi:hypothetical protein
VSERERFKQNVLMDANGDKDRMIDMLVDEVLYFYMNTSAGYIQERRWHGWLRPASAKPRVEPVLLESERG